METSDLQELPHCISTPTGTILLQLRAPAHDNDTPSDSRLYKIYLGLSIGSNKIMNSDSPLLRAELWDLGIAASAYSGLTVSD